MKKPRSLDLLLCPVDDVTHGAIAAASVAHPTQADVELVTPGVPLTREMLRRMAGMGIRTIWITHDATADLDGLLDPSFGKTRRAIYEQLKTDFREMSNRTVSTVQLHRYGQLVRDFVLELLSGHRMAALTEHLLAGPGGLFTHGANVAYLSLLVGLQLESYIIMNRPKLSVEHARDLTSLGVGAILHDVGKIGLPEAVEKHHELRGEMDLDPSSLQWPEPQAADGDAEAHPQDDRAGTAEEIYRSHALRGYRILQGSRAPASATQIVLNHHQRWDGQGFPNVSDYADHRDQGPQQGAGIHVLARIVAAGNVLDNLVRDGEGNCQPPIKALCELAGERFKNWLDPVVRDAMVRVIPPFAVGQHVRLSDGRDAVVITPSVEQPCRPTVRLLAESERLPNGRFPTLDLRLEATVSIAECGGVDVRPYLFTLKERPPMCRMLTSRAG